MTLEHGTPQQITHDLLPVLEEAVQWYNTLSFAALFPQEGGAANVTDAVVGAKIVSFPLWLETAQEQQKTPASVLHDLQTLYDDLMEQAENIFSLLKDGKEIEFSGFKILNDLYTAFLLRLYRLEADKALDGQGVDLSTGLRSVEAIEGDLQRERERLSRQGNPFSLVVCRLDGHNVDAQLQAKTMDIIARAIKACMRTFDDAYYLKGGQFLLSLKHADIIGAEAAVNRLRRMLAKDPENEKGMITLSYCLCEPLPEDKPIKMIADMRDDLANNAAAQDAVLKLLEMSELERFVQQSE